MQVKILIGTIAFMLTMIIFGFAALQEPQRLARFDAANVGRSVEAGASLFDNNCTTCHGVNAKAELCYDAEGNQIGCAGRALNHAPLVCGQVSTRMDESDWTGSKFAFVEGTLIAGRTQNGMPAWAQDVGGPLQKNEIEDLTYYILNFENEELCAAVSYLFPFPGLPLPDIFDEIAGFNGEEHPEAYEAYLALTDAEAYDVNNPNVTIPEIILPVVSPGNVDRGRELFEVTYGCAACHGNPEGAASTAAAGPWQGDLVSNVENGLRKDGYTARQYAYESIINPAVYIVDTYANGMPNNFASRMSENPQDLEDIITYLMFSNGAE